MEHFGVGIVLQNMHRRYPFFAGFCSAWSCAYVGAVTDKKTVCGIGRKSNEINGLIGQMTMQMSQIRQIVVDFRANVLTR